MSKDKIIVDEPIVETVEETAVTFEPGQPVAKIVKENDGYHVVDYDGTVGKVLPISKDGIVYILTPNASCRKFYNVKNLNKLFDEGATEVILTYKPSKKLGPQSSRTVTMPNAKLIAYLSEEEQEEYKAIIARAIAARDADKAKPMTEKEKLQAKLAKAKAAYEKLLAEAANDEEVSE
jgi:hypothetical protein